MYNHVLTCGCYRNSDYAVRAVHFEMSKSTQSHGNACTNDHVLRYMQLVTKLNNAGLRFNLQLKFCGLFCMQLQEFRRWAKNKRQTDCIPTSAKPSGTNASYEIARRETKSSSQVNVRCTLHGCHCLSCLLFRCDVYFFRVHFIRVCMSLE